MSAYIRPIVTIDLFGKYQCSNGGLSARSDIAYLYPAGTFLSEIEPEKRFQAVEIKFRDIGGPVFHLQPIAEPSGKVVGPMFGGYYGATSDSRFSEEVARVAKAAGYGDRHRLYGAMALHDRFETPEQYRALSV